MPFELNANQLRQQREDRARQLYQEAINQAAQVVYNAGQQIYYVNPYAAPVYYTTVVSELYPSWVSTAPTINRSLKSKLKAMVIGNELTKKEFEELCSEVQR